MAQDQRRFYVILGLIVVGAGIFFISRMDSGGSISIPANPVITTADTAGFRGYIIGSASAPVEITEYADFQCPGCANFDIVQWPAVKAGLVDAGKARFRFREFPLASIHPQALLAAHSAACAGEQDKFWDAKSAIFVRQNDWAMRSDATAVLRDVVKSVGVDVGKWNDCMTSGKYAGRIQASYDEGVRVGVQYTPSFLIGGRIYINLSSDGIIKLVDSIAATIKPASGAPSTPGK